MSSPLSYLYISALYCLTLIFQSAAAQIEITDSHGKYSFKKPPERVVVLNWALAEQMLELGVNPIGMADISGYARHASKPVVASATVDVGDRLSPKLSIIKNLKPDIIVIGYSQRSLLRPLSNIATVIYFKNFGERYNNFEKSKDRFIELSKLFNKTELAEQKLIELNSALGALRVSLKQAFDEKNLSLPNVQITVPSGEHNDEHWLFGKNSMPYYAASALGLEVLSGSETNQYGISKLSQYELDELTIKARNDSRQANTTCRLILSSYVQESLAQTVNQPDCVTKLDYQNAFGGSMSVLYFAQAINSALLKTIK